MSQLTLTVENDDAPADKVRAVADGLTAFNRTHVPDPGRASSASSCATSRAA